MKPIYAIPIGIVISILWTILLFKIGQSKKKVARWFYPLLYAPLAISFIMYVSGSDVVFSAIMNIWSLVTLLVLALERFVWGITLKRVSGEDRLAWFFVIMYLPIIGWMIYYITQNDR